MIEKRTDRHGKAKYRVRVAVTDPATGTVRHQQVGVFTTRQQAERAEREAIVKRDHGTLKERTTMTTGELLEEWLTGKRAEISGNAWTDYATSVHMHLQPSLGQIPVQRLSAATVQAQYTAWREAGLSARTIRGCHQRLSQALDQAVRHNLVASNVCKSVKPPRVERKAVNVWTPEEVTVFLQHAPSDSLHPLWHLLVLEGMRRGEALGLRWSDVDFQKGVAHIVQTVIADRTKEGKGRALIQPQATTAAGARSVRLTSETLAALREHRDRQRFRRQQAGEAWQGHDLIICTKHGRPIQPGGNVQRAFTSILLKAGLRRIRVHDLRHTAATMLLLADVPPKVVSERLGHAAVGITLDIYSHVLPDMQMQAADAISEVLARARNAPQSG